MPSVPYAIAQCRLPPLITSAEVKNAWSYTSLWSDALLSTGTLPLPYEQYGHNKLTYKTRSLISKGSRGVVLHY